MMGSIRRRKTKRRTRFGLTLDSVYCYLTMNPRDLDQIHADIRSTKHLNQQKSAKPATELPGLGQFYCLECAKWFEAENGLLQHRKGKNHKRRLV